MPKPPLVRKLPNPFPFRWAPIPLVEDYVAAVTRISVTEARQELIEYMANGQISVHGLRYDDHEAREIESAFWLSVIIDENGRAIGAGGGKTLLTWIELNVADVWQVCPNDEGIQINVDWSKGFGIQRPRNHRILSSYYWE